MHHETVRERLKTLWLDPMALVTPRRFATFGGALFALSPDGERLAVEGSSAAPTGWVYTRSDDTTEHFDAAGRLREVKTREGYRFTTRLHIYIWGDRRGV